MATSAKIGVAARGLQRGLPTFQEVPDAHSAALALLRPPCVRRARGRRRRPGRPRRGGIAYLDNATIRLGVDLGEGGTIVYLARSRGGTDLLHRVEPVYAAGDWRTSASRGDILASSGDGNTLYTRVLPRSESGVACACLLETWISLRGSAASVRHRLTVDRPADGGQVADLQQLPALRTAGTAYRLFAYVGSRPYTGTPSRRLDSAGFSAPEHWAALVGPGGRGVGLFVPDLIHFDGISGTAAGSDRPGPNGYLAATSRDIVDARLVFSSRYSLVLGTLAQIRAYAVSHRPNARPQYEFRGDRRHWTYVNASDDGRLAGSLRVRLDRNDPQLVGPEQWWPAGNAPTLFVRGAWSTRQSVATVFWSSTAGRPFDARRRLRFAVIPDGRFHTYRVRLAASRLYMGQITGLRLDPVDAAEIGGFVDITCISSTPCPVDRAVEGRLESEPLGDAFLETFDQGLGQIWHTSGDGSGATLGTPGGRLEVAFAREVQNGPNGYFGAHIGTSCRLRGDFDVRVDYQLAAWPTGNGVQVFMNTYYGPGPDFESVTRESFPWGEFYGARIDQVYNSTLTADPRGTLRLARAGGLLSASEWTGRAWRVVGERRAVRADAIIALGAASNEEVFAKRDVKVEFDNFDVASGRLVCG